MNGMERRYAFRDSDYSDLPPYIYAETAGDLGTSVGSYTLEEMLAMPGGPEALEAWRACDDRALVGEVSRDMALAAAEDAVEGRG